MGPGKRYRMGRIFGEDGRTLILPVDHGLTLGRIEGLEIASAVLLDAARRAGIPASETS